MKRNYFKLVPKITLFGALCMIGLSSMAENKPKNIILLIGDGMSYNTVKATNYFVKGVDDTLVYQKFPIKLGMSTYNAQNGDVNNPMTYGQEYRPDSAWLDFNWVSRSGYYTDSAPAATAMASGKKTFDGTINIDMNRDTLFTIAQKAKKLGKSSGVITTVQFSHATPAGFTAHRVNRNDYSQIATEMIMHSGFDVIIGAGHPEYNDNATLRDNKDYRYVGDSATWQMLKNNQTTNGKLNLVGKTWTLLQDSLDFVKIANGSVAAPDRLIGVPKVATTFNQVRTVVDAQVPYSSALNSNIPTLKDATMAGLKVLSKNNNGFFVMIEGGAIDWANHANQKGKMIEEQIDFNNTVDAVVQWVENNGGWENNLVIVTSDHECGYLLGPNDNDNKPTTNPIINNGKGNVPSMRYNSGNHTNMLVPFYSKGQGADMFIDCARRYDPIRGSYIDNTDISRVLFKMLEPEQPTIKNVIYMISDGMSDNVLKATKYFTAKDNYTDFDFNTFMSTFHLKNASDSIGDYVAGYNSGKAWSDTSYVRYKPTDSAPAGTAMGTGKKTYDGSINMNVEREPLTTIAELAKQKGKATGVVSSVQFAHATPATFGAAHNVNRNNYSDIAKEMIYKSQLDVIIGAGHPDYDDNNTLRSKKEYKYVGDSSTWQMLKANNRINGNDTVKGRTWTLIEDKAEFEQVANGENIPQRLIGVAKVATTFQQVRQGDGQVYSTSTYNQDVPTLEIASKAALNVLKKNASDKGFFVMIEGGAVDWANHANQKGRVIEEQEDFNNALEAVRAWVEANSNWNETLLIVTSDHECGYLSGPKSNSTKDMYENQIIDNGAGNMPSMDYYSGDHTNHLVPFFAKGVTADELGLYASHYDYRRGYYMDNTDAAFHIISQWKNLEDVKPSSIEEIVNDSQYSNTIHMNVYPNPTKGQLRIELGDIDAKIDVLDISGRIVYRATTGNTKFTNLDLSHLNSGMYIVKAQTKRGSAIQKVIIER